MTANDDGLSPIGVPAQINLHELDPMVSLGSKPSFAWIGKSLLVIDPRYQRGLTGRRSAELIGQIVEAFTWSKFQPLTVTELDNGQFAVVDGQHRGAAALLHPLIEEVPAWIVDAPDVRAQAKVFVGINEDRNRMTSLQVYKAQLAARDHDASQVDELCRQVGVIVAYQLSGSCRELPPRHTQAVSTLKKLLAQHGDRPVRDALEVLVAAYANVPNQLRGQVIKALTVLFVRHGSRIDRERLVKVLENQYCEDLIDASRKIQRLMGTSTEAGMLTAIMRAYDRGLPESRRLERVKKVA
ncbi:hypothetical protein FBY14_104173 [Azospirillum brasilense]|nr:hypothetical protein FBY14_104173 [Azospirillum brasilense]